MTDSSPRETAPPSAGDMKLFWACFVALVATSFVFGVRANVIGELATIFELSETQKGTILGVGLWPFAISIIIFSLIIDKIGYKVAAIIAIVCHVGSLLLTMFATGYVTLFWATFLVAIANGIVEAFINPVVATAFKTEKSKWLNILHAGWPAGMALGALFTIVLGGASWQLKYGMCFIPVAIYAVLIIPRKFPVQERVAAGVTYREMLRQVGGIGFFIIGSLLVMGVIQLVVASMNLDIHPSKTIVYGVVAGLVFGIAGWVYTGSPGHWMFLMILLIMGPLATTELGTDSWMPDLLQGVGLSASGAGWVFIYVSTLMTILRFYAGPIVHRFSPIGLLVASAAVAIVGLIFLSKASIGLIVVAATVYALGKTFLWSTTLGLVSEQFPKGGALTLNGVSAVGVLGMGIIGTPFMGVLQDREVDKQLAADMPAIHQQVSAPARPSIFGDIPSLDGAAIETLSEADAATLKSIQDGKKKGSFAKIAVLPGFMLLVFLILFFYFRSRGGYKPVEI
ncbi:MFS transporter [bacterium]|nr:MFS transporter [bacterium]MDB4632761.1 MFS transporter [bacterium]